MPRDRNRDARGEALNPTPPQEGLLVAHYGIAVEVLFEGGERSMVRVKRNSGHVVGDAVLVRDDLLSRLPRKTELRRRDARGGLHLVAANLDVLGIVVAPSAPDGFIDRAIVAARAADLHPFIVVNKCDLPGSEDLLATVKKTYAASVPVFPLSALNGEGLVTLQVFLAEGHRGAFVGTTGVGKSSLLNALCPQIDLRTAEVSEYKSMGRHTTTVSTLHALPGGGELVDTPGFRDFGLVEISPEELAAHFPGFEKTRELTCRFRNCRHRSEPGCSVVELVGGGEITAERYETYLVLLTEVETDEEERKRKGWRKS